MAGAYRIVHRASDRGLVQEIEAALSFPPAGRAAGHRAADQHVLVRPGRPTPAADWRPQIHDSDGLAIWTGAGERIWRPLANPPRVDDQRLPRPRPTRLRPDAARPQLRRLPGRRRLLRPPPERLGRAAGRLGRGLGAAGRDPDRPARPTTTSSPSGRRRAPVKAGRRAGPALSPALGGRGADAGGVARVVATRVGRGGRPGQPPPPGVRKFVVDFAGGRLAGLTRRAACRPVVGSQPRRRRSMRRPIRWSGPAAGG